ncbi:Eco57I restriction-modification methylase domain-containing protein [Pseudoduganella sp. UC29_71]|uniref:Eco57I restriction-modification methylase domain-containing protein n=1 Tax=Pseudoduganella sp. UC29_71 TaxID=3350174 RepID=UPI003670FD16
MSVAETRESPFKTKQSFYKFVRALQKEVDAGDKDFVRLTKTILVHWLKEVAPTLPASPDLYQFENPLSVVAVEFLHWLTAQSLLDSTYWLSSAYAIWSGDEHQKSHAMYFTPPSITKRMLDDLTAEHVDYKKHVFYDPACGGAAFLTPIAVRIRDELIKLNYSSDQIISHVEQHVLGSELDPVLCTLSQNFLRAIFEKQIAETGREPNFDIVCADSLFLSSGKKRKIDVIVCNPPYRKLNKVELSSYVSDYNCVIESQANLYTLFIYLCLNIVRSGGLIKLISPMSFVSGKTFGKIRYEIQRQSEIISFGIVGERLNVFIDVEQETIITLMRKKSANVRKGVSEVFKVCRDGSRQRVGTTLISPGTGVWAIPRRKEDSVIIDRGSRCRARIADYGYRARIGAFVWNRDTKKTYFSLSEAKKSRAKLIVPLIWSTDISGERPINLNDRRNSENEPLYVDIGDYNHRSLVRHDALLLQRVTSSDQTRRLVATRLDISQWPEFPGFVGENHVVILESDEAVPKCGVEMLRNVLVNEQVERYFRCISGSTNVSVFELNQLPLPCPQCVGAAVESGLSISDAIEMILAAEFSNCNHMLGRELK